jgi:glycosyltransferase involved in cell wall biosynthesis
MNYALSVVIPVYNEAQHLALTIDRLYEAVERSGYEAELVVVDDGSTDGSARTAEAAVGERFALEIVQQPNRGRFHAVRSGRQHATGRYVLILGSRVRLRPAALEFIRDRERAGETVWTGHVHIHADRNPYGRFMNVVTEIAWHDYFDDPRTTSFDLKDFDRYPKGSGCFFAPRELLLDAFDALPSRYADVRYANDDAPMLRRIARSTNIHISPSFTSDYIPRATLRTFISHSVHRGMVFLDGHGRRESRFFPYVVAFYPLSAAVLIASMARPRVLPVAAVATALGAASVAVSHRRSRSEVATVALLAPVWVLALGVGLWRGVGMLPNAYLRRRQALGWR